MLSIIVYIGIAQMQGTAKERAWVTNLMRSKSAQAALSQAILHPPAAAIRPASPEVSVSHGPDWDEHRITDPAFWRGVDEGNKARRDASRLIDEERPQEAYDYISGYERTNPVQHDMVEDLVIECSLLVGRYDEAYRRSVVLVNTPGWDSEDAYLRLSLASAMKGEVYPGQLEFVQASLRYSFWNSQIHDSISLPPGTEGTPKEIAILTCLARGLHAGRQTAADFFETALRLDPQNQLAARRAIDWYKSMGRYSGMTRVASMIANNLPPGKTRDEFLKVVDLNKNLKDKPLDPIVKP